MVEEDWCSLYQTGHSIFRCKIKKKSKQQRFSKIVKFQHFLLISKKNLITILPKSIGIFFTSIKIKNLKIILLKSIGV